MLRESLQAIKQRIDNQARLCHRDPNTITLLAASKAQSHEVLREAYVAGLRQFGENYLQEGIEKQKKLQDLSITWHFIGPIQSNKAAAISAHFDWVHSVARASIAHKLHQYRAATQPRLQVCIQVNLDSEPGKSGVRIEDCEDFVLLFSQLPRLELRGLMAIPMPHTEYSEQFNSLIRLKQLQEHLNKTYNLRLDTLSMGMSMDMEAAIAAGSTLLRVGRALFGERE